MFDFVLVIVVDAVVLAFAYYVAYASVGVGGFYKNFERKVALKMISDAWPLVVSALMIGLYMKLDQFMIKEILGARALGVYSAGIRLVEGVMFWASIMSSSLFPAILMSREKSASLYRERMLFLYRGLILSAFLFTAVFVIGSEQWVAIIFGEGYRESSKVLFVYSLSMVFMFLQVASAKWYIAENLQMLALVRNFSGLIINIVLNLILLPVYGVVGAAVATVFSYAVSGYVADSFSSKTIDQFRLKTFAFATFYKILGAK